MKTIKAIAILLLLSTTNSWALCEANVDKIKVFYINGMFTDYSAFQSNKTALETFIRRYLASDGFDTSVDGSHNRSEEAIDQFIEVATQKYTDASATIQEAIIQFLNGEYDFTQNTATTTEVQNFLRTVNFVYTGVLSEGDSRIAKIKLENLLDQCLRLVLVTHSQGNFYGNALFNDIYGRYYFPNGYALAEYPMFGTMQIASPVYTPGGGVADVHPQTIGHLTNDNDIVMAFVREVVGSINPNYTAPFNLTDFTGHGLEMSYLSQPGQAVNIANQMKGIAYNFTPYPMHGQNMANSSALDGFGYSSVSDFLDIEFDSGGVYRYDHVPEVVFSDLKTTSSQGGYFNAYIRDYYAYTKLE